MQVSDKSDSSVVVIDNGSYTTKAGFAASDAPAVIVGSVVGRNVTPHKESCIGREAKGKESILNLKYPINRGIITHWDAMEEVVT